MGERARHRGGTRGGLGLVALPAPSMQCSPNRDCTDLWHRTKVRGGVGGRRWDPLNMSPGSAVILALTLSLIAGLVTIPIPIPIPNPNPNPNSMGLVTMPTARKRIEQMLTKLLYLANQRPSTATWS